MERRQVLQWGVWSSLLGLAGAAEEEASPAASLNKKPSTTEPEAAPKVLLAGQVVLLSEALKARKIKHYPEDLTQQVVLQTAEHELVPLVPDWRGRAFHQDERLRNRPVELVVRRHPGVPHVQVLMVFTFDEKGARQYTDYWCDICSIPMYEIKDCECCQGPIRLRFQPQPLPEYLRKSTIGTGEKK